MGKWSYAKLGKIASRVCSGGTPKSTCLDYYADGTIPWLNTKEVCSCRIYQTEKHITQEGLVASSAKWVPANSVVVAMYGATAGNVAITRIPLTTNQACCNLTINADLADSDYVYYAVRDSYHDLFLLANGAAQQNLNAQVIKEFEIPCPDLQTQRKIAAVLSALDDKIENNRRICKTLEEMAQAIFKSWFVDFEPWGGVMPEGWRSVSIYEFADITYGAPFKSKLFNEKSEGRPIVRIRDLKNNATNTFTTEQHPKEYLIQPGDLVVGMDGEFRPYIWANAPALLNQRVCVFSPHDEENVAFLYFTIIPQLMFIEQTEAATTVIHIGKEDFDQFRVLLPSSKILHQFNAFAARAFKTIVSRRLENATLASMRDALLPKLMSGEIDVEGVAV